MNIEKLELEYERLLNRSLGGITKKIELLLSEYIGGLSSIIAGSQFENFTENKILNAQINQQRQIFTTDYGRLLYEYSIKAQELSNRKNTEFVLGMDLGLKKENIVKYLARPQGINLRQISGRVWKTTDGFHKNLKTTLRAGMLRGDSAYNISHRLQYLLNNPLSFNIDEVDDKFKTTILERNIKNYKPGRGVYRSAKQNAYRVARTEVNRAYRLQDSENRQSLPFIRGVEVKLSASHPFYDICDELKGEYPKGLNFGGWHPNCICYSVPILPSDADAIKAIKGDTSNIKPITKVPKRANDYLKLKKESIKKAPTEPFFLQENPNLFDF